MADSKVSALTELSVPALGDWLFAVDDPAGTPADASLSLSRLGGLLGRPAGGRLTLTTATPVTTSDVTSSTLYYTPYIHNLIALYDGTRWVLRSFSELSMTLSSLTASRGYDVFAYDNSGTAAFERLVWTSGTARATALAYQDGVLVKSGDATRRYLGSFYSTSTTQTTDNARQRLLWNYYNRVVKHLQRHESTDQWTPATSWGYANASSTNRIEVFSGYSEESIDVLVATQTNAYLDRIRMAIGVDSTSTPSGIWMNQDGVASSLPHMAHYSGVVPLGFHYYAWIDKQESGGSGLVYGDDTSDIGCQGGIQGEWRC